VPSLDANHHPNHTGADVAVADPVTNKVPTISDGSVSHAAPLLPSERKGLFSTIVVGCFTSNELVNDVTAIMALGKADRHSKKPRRQ
jgi:hypothetical protein